MKSCWSGQAASHQEPTPMTTLAEQLDRLCRGDRQRVEALAERLLTAERSRQAAATVDSTSSVPHPLVPRRDGTTDAPPVNPTTLTTGPTCTARHPARPGRRKRRAGKPIIWPSCGCDDCRHYAMDLCQATTHPPPDGPRGLKASTTLFARRNLRIRNRVCGLSPPCRGLSGGRRVSGT